MKGIRFGDVHSYDDLQLILSGKEMGAPSVKTEKIDIPGADSALDMTDFFGEPKFEDVTHRFEFSTIVPHGEFLPLYTKIKNAIHGKKTRIILDDDPSFAWVGRCYVTSFTDARGIGTVDIECDCEPYKYKIVKTVVSRVVSGTEVIRLTNARKRAVPTVTIQADTSLRIVFGDGIWDLGSGSYTLPELQLIQGVNDVTVSGVGSIVFEWQEGDL